MTIKTKLHTFSFNTKTNEGRDLWNELNSRLEAEYRAGWRPKPTRLAVHHDTKVDNHFVKLCRLNGHTIELETNHLFPDQWNTPPTYNITESGLRVFDFEIQETYFISGPKTGIIRGHYLEQTDEMRLLRAYTLQCGYCGAYHPSYSTNLVFCDECVDSEYLEDKDLRLLRLVPVSERYTFKYPS